MTIKTFYSILFLSFSLGTHALYEFRNLMAQRKKLFLSLLVLLLRHMYLRPEGTRVNRCCSGCEGSAVIALALQRHCVLVMSSGEGRGLPVIHCTVLMILCRFFLSATVQLVYQAVMQYVRTLLMVLR